MKKPRLWTYDDSTLMLRIIPQRCLNPNDKRTPQEVMKDLGVEYERHIPRLEWNEHIFTGCSINGTKICHMWYDMLFSLPVYVEMVDCP